jgi:hypothetical protein
MKTVAEVIGVSRSNLADRLQERCKKRGELRCTNISLLSRLP